MPEDVSSEVSFFCSSQSRNIFPLFVALIVSENRIHQSHVKFPIGFGVSPADPAVVVFHAFHVKFRGLGVTSRIVNNKSIFL